jgi:murein L,D-transpeptidase YcbB/YkuD
MVLDRNSRPDFAASIAMAPTLLLLGLLAAGVPALLGTSAAAAAAAAKPAAPAGPERTLRSAVQAGRLSGLRWSSFPDLRADLERLYEKTGYQPLWVEGGAPTPGAKALIARLARADSVGLEPSDFDASWLTSQAARLSSLSAGKRSSESARFDLALSVAALRFTTSLHRGRIDPRLTGAELGERSEEWSAADAVRALQDPDAQADALRALEPDYAHYRSLVRALTHYRALAKDPTYTRDLDLPANAKPGARLPAPGRLRAVLEASGDLKPRGKKASKEGAGPYSEELVDGVQRFQRRHGLLPDGILWPGTIDELQRPFRERVRQIDLALERWRWMPPAPSVPPVVVNVPAYRLYAPSEAPDREEGALAMDVLVGSAGADPTPVFAAQMTHVIFRPYWELPLDIMLYEFGPRADWDAENLEKRGFVLVDDTGRDTTSLPLTPENLARLGNGLRMRQLPGPNNALGLVKFMFPNPYNIYLHDTSVPGLFIFSRRDMSHGCIRVSEPAELAAHVLRDVPGWTTERAQAAMEGSEDNLKVELPVPVPVFIVYSTAEATESGEARFYSDVYGLDKRLEEMLKKGYPYPKASSRGRAKYAQGRISTEVPSGMTR